MIYHFGLLLRRSSADRSFDSSCQNCCAALHLDWCCPRAPAPALLMDLGLRSNKSPENKISFGNLRHKHTWKAHDLGTQQRLTAVTEQPKSTDHWLVLRNQAITIQGVEKSSPRHFQRCCWMRHVHHAAHIFKTLFNTCVSTCGKQLGP